MSGLDDSSTEKTVLLPLVPTYPDNKPIQWDDNDASLGGLIADYGEYFERTDGLCVCSFVPLVVLCVFHLLRFVRHKLMKLQVERAQDDAPRQPR